MWLPPGTGGLEGEEGYPSRGPLSKLVTLPRTLVPRKESELRKSE